MDVIENAKLKTAAPAICLPPSGRGPGLLLMASEDRPSLVQRAEYLALEGYVVQPAIVDGIASAEAALATLAAHPALDGMLAAVAGGDAAGEAAVALAERKVIDALVLYDHAMAAARLATLPCPATLHLGIAASGETAPIAALRQCAAAQPGRFKVFVYRDVPAGFADPDSPGWNPFVAGIAYSRSLAQLRAALGPYYNLSDLWDRHVECEFVLKDATENMKTMVAEPYVNHVPTMTGGVGHDLLKRFYTHHFIGQSPGDRSGVPISRTIGTDRVIEERVLRFTHDIEIDWMLPGIKPTGKKVEIPFVIVITFLGDKLYNEHIYWDQASVLAQLGLIDPTGLPIAGVEQARKMLDKTLPSNTLMAKWPTSVDKPV
jgi:carboxymethylenebutenolidase